MNQIFKLYLVAVLLIYPIAATAYKEPTHEDMSEAAAFASVLNNPETLSALGLKYGIDDEKQKFPNSDGKEKTIKFLIRDGANFEDNFPRSRHHFFDPLNGQGLTTSLISGTPSPDWALEGNAGFGAQEFSYKDARDYLYQALTSTTEDDRKQYFGKTFQTLGQVIHHIQDMAQPQHVRNDAHCDVFLLCAPLGQYNPSRYETYSNDVRLNLLYTGYPSATFPTPRQFWTDNGQGIADFTNRNFVSAGTNFDTALYTYPRLAESVPKDEDANVLLQSVGLTPPPECLPPNDSCVMTFFGTAVNDAYRSGASGVNERTSTQSIFDQDLKVAGQDPAFSLNRFNFDSAHPFLIPRAVGYSAGLIDYFFRGKINLVADPAASGSYIIKNLSNEAMDGTFELHYDAANDDRQPVPGASWTLVVPANGQSTPLTFTLPTTPPAKTPGQYMLVFRGTLGQESNAVVGKKVRPGGMVVVGLGASSNSNSVAAFRWTQAGGMEIIGASSVYDVATGVSADGSVVVGNFYDWGGSDWRSFRWTQAGGIELIESPFVSVLGSPTFASGVSADGSVVVGTAIEYALPTAYTHAFRWTQTGGMEIIGAGAAYGVSADGSVVVGTSGSSIDYSAFRWTQAGGTEIIIGAGGAYGVSADGSVVVGATTGGAFRWTQAGGMKIIDAGAAYGVSADGSVVVGSDANRGAFRWTQDDGMEIIGAGAAYGVSSNARANEED